MNKEVEYGYVLLRETDKKLYCFRDGQDGVCTTLHAATKFETERQATIKRDQLYKQYQKLFKVKRVVIEYAMYNL